MTAKDYLQVGFSKPSLYKRSVWRQAEKKMEHLVSLGKVEKITGEIKYKSELSIEQLVSYL